MPLKIPPSRISLLQNTAARSPDLQDGLHRWRVLHEAQIREYSGEARRGAERRITAEKKQAGAWRRRQALFFRGGGRKEAYGQSTCSPADGGCRKRRQDHSGAHGTGAREKDIPRAYEGRVQGDGGTLKSTVGRFTTWPLRWGVLTWRPSVLLRGRPLGPF